MKGIGSLIIQFGVFALLAACGASEQAQTDSSADAETAYPTFSVIDGWGSPADSLVLGTVAGIAVDPNDNIWVLHRPRTIPAEQAARAAPPVVVFDADGNMLDAWGGPAVEYEWPQNEHGIHIDNDGFVWISGNYCTNWINEGLRPVNDDHLLKLTMDGELVQQFGFANASMGNADTKNFHRPAAMQVHAATNEIFIADGYGNHRVIVLDADTGAYKRMWGAFGGTPQDDHRCGVSFFGSDAPAWDSDQFSIVHGLAVSDDGMVYVADRENGRVQIFDLNGEYLSQIELGADSDPMTVAFSADETQRFLYVWGANRINVYEREPLSLLTTIDDDPGTGGPGHMMATDSQGNIYMARLAGGLEKLELTSAAGR